MGTGREPRPFLAVPAFTLRGSGLVGVSLLATAAGCNRPLSAAECIEMLDRYVDMSIAADPGLATLTPAQVEAVREVKRAVKKAEPRYLKVAEQCEREVGRREYRCAMAANTMGDWEACID